MSERAASKTSHVGPGRGKSASRARSVGALGLARTNTAASRATSSGTSGSASTAISAPHTAAARPTQTSHMAPRQGSDGAAPPASTPVKTALSYASIAARAAHNSPASIMGVRSTHAGATLAPRSSILPAAPIPSAPPSRNIAAPHVDCNTGGRTQPYSACAAAVTAPRRVRRRVNLQRLRLMCHQ